MATSIGSLDIDPEHDPDAGTYRVQFDSSEYKASTVVVLALAAVTDTDTEILTRPVLNACLDPDSLDGLFAPQAGGTRRSGGRVTFPIAGYDVTVHSDGWVVLDPGAND